MIETRQKNYSERICGVTLVEVLAGLALLGTLLVSMVLARGQLLEQKIKAARMLEAIAVADRLLAQWWEDPAAIPVGESGEIKDAGMVWRTERRRDEEAEKNGAQVVTLELKRTVAAPGEESFQIEVVLPIPEDERVSENE